jgi:tRNA pseudouridine55 synthase
VSEPFGFLNIDKPSGMTSHDVVAKIRRELKLNKVGHAGTLDPLAAGVLIICMGGATRLSEYVMQSTKTYRARVHLGVTTTTYDAEGAVVQKCDATHISRHDVEQALTAFVGDIDQMPPMYSAIKQSGRKLYELARAGETVERALRPVRIDSLEISDWSPPQFTLDVACSAGTYIRSLAYDIGEALGVGAHLSGLTRLASGIFRQSTALSLEALFSAANWQQYLVPPHLALVEWPFIAVNPAEIERLAHGQNIRETPDADGEIAFAYDESSRLIAIVRAEEGLWRPHKVFL